MLLPKISIWTGAIVALFGTRLPTQIFYSLGAGGESFHFGEGNGARQVFHAAIGRYRKPLRRHASERGADGFGDELRRLGI